MHGSSRLWQPTPKLWLPYLQVLKSSYFKKPSLRDNPHMIYTPSFTLLYSKKGEIRGTQNESLFLVSCLASEKNMSFINNILKNPY